ncbi:hypothetical protein TTHERM_00732530 (macronuclear) [Tetrahymena thermophila SB210]|uniref:Uncharacterized protein n=1 Tax=Tetrahymena thermophila (strain SB210) TaxID=312017 RepID=Q245F8_TETTS|nr:hypothetical protein TTHERM_00732530 [Tetrahymena thermophila SB210]EAS03406.2 hypothetical protein TTHERM_00732530 [Tetrahymena thermophila SB210]|eukprot:XP_001023651.2 hypothetical protein TTHERM_00732530 [Tetrahymena thermophila SB210]
MSIVKLDLRQQNSIAQNQNPCQKQVPAPLVKIDLTPEKQAERKSDHLSSNYCSTNSTNSASSSNTQGHISPSSSIVLTAANQPNIGSCTQLNCRNQANSIANFINSPFSIGSSPTQKNSNSQLQITPQSSTIQQVSTNNNSAAQVNLPHNLGSLSNVNNQNQRNCQQQERKISQNSTEVSNDESSSNIQLLQLKLQQQVQENNELKEQLLKEKSKTKMIITENLTMQEELRKAQQRLKEYEQLNMMRQSQALSQRASWMRTSPNKKVFTPINSSNTRGGFVNHASKAIPSEFSAEFSYEKQNSLIVDSQAKQNLHQNQLSQHSILDILHNLNGEEESFYTDRQNKDIIVNDKVQSVKISQFSKSKTTSINQQIRRRSNLTPSFNRLDAINYIPKKTFS